MGPFWVSCPRESTEVFNLHLQENIEWADLIVTTGGDGTFLMGANKVQNSEKPIVGFNTDPTRSEGYLCLPKKYSINIREAVSKLFEVK